MPDPVEPPGPPVGLERLGAAETRRRVAAGTFSVHQTLEDCLETLEVRNAAISAVVAVDIQSARSRADSLDRAQATGEPIGHLHGVPLTPKETFDVAGMPTTWDDPERVSHVSTGHSVVAERLLAQGAVILGTTNVPERLTDWESHNRLFGSTRNPRHPHRSAKRILGRKRGRRGKWDDLGRCRNRSGRIQREEG